MTESHRSSEAFGAHDDEDAAELEQLRREAATLREQLQNAVDAAASGTREVQQLEARIDSLAARNAKLMDTLKEARQQLLALREEVDRLGQPPSGYGVLLGAHDDDTVDVFTSGRKMRLTCSPNIDVKELKKGQTRPAQRGADRGGGRHTSRPSARSARCARCSPTGTAPWWSGTPTRSASSGWPSRWWPSRTWRPRWPRRARRRPAAAQAAPRRLAAGRHQGRLRLRAHPQGRGRGPGPRGGARRRLQRHRRPDPPDRADPRRRRTAVPAQGALPRVLAAPAQGRAALRPARLRQDADRQGGRQLAGQEDGRGARRGRPRGQVATSSTSRAPSC